MFNWLTRKSFGYNLLAAVLLIFLIAVAFFVSLGFITRHGKTIKVPEVVGQPAAKADYTLESLRFNPVVQDSGYVDSLPPLTVLRQVPEAGNIVKVNRTIYLTLNKLVPPMTAMPDLVNYSFRSALMTLESQRLALGDTIYKPDIAKNAVLDQLFDGKPIKPGTMLPEGSRVTLVLGDGVGNAANPVPNLVGLTYLQALDLLSASNLNHGVVLLNEGITDTANAIVYRQIPTPKNETGEPNYIHAGESIDMWLSQTMPVTTDSTANPFAP